MFSTRSYSRSRSSIVSSSSSNLATISTYYGGSFIISQGFLRCCRSRRSSRCRRHRRSTRNDNRSNNDEWPWPYMADSVNVLDLVSCLVSIRLYHTRNGRDSTSCRRMDSMTTLGMQWS